MEAFKKAQKQIEAESKHEAKKLRFDFDQAIAEVEQEELIISFNGKEYTLPSDCPTPLLLKIIDNPNDDSVIITIIGKHLKDAIKDSDNVPLPAFKKLVKFIQDAWGLKSAESAKNNLTPDS